MENVIPLIIYLLKVKEMEKQADKVEMNKTVKSLNHTTHSTIQRGDIPMRTNNLFSLLGAAMVAILLLVSANDVYASGTLAGTTITNQASVQYNAGSNVRTSSSNQVTMTVGYKVSINLVSSSSSTTTVDSTTVYTAFYASNNGNYTDNLQFSLTHVPAGWSAQLYRDKNNNQVYDAGTDSAITSGGAIAADTTVADRIPLILAVTIPSVADNYNDSVTVTVQSNGSGPGGVVRVGGAGPQVYAAHVTIAKPVLSFSVVPTYGANKIPGESESYALTVTNTGHAATNGNSTITWLYDNTNLASVNTTGGVSSSASSGTATWTISSLSALTGTVTVNLTATIEQTSHNGTGVPYNTTITNGTTGSNAYYYDGVNHYHTNVASTTAFNVGQASGAYVSQLIANQSGNPGDSVVYQIRVKNRGNAAMTFTLSQARSGGDLDTTHLFTATSGVAGSQPFTTASINAGDSLSLYVYLRVNVTGQNGNTIIRLLTASPNTAGVQPTGAGNYNPSITITTTVTAPNLNIVLSQAFVSGVGTITNPAPGDVIEYTLTITNNGTGTATNMTTSNAIPGNTTFVQDAYGTGKGIQVGGTAMTNVVDGDIASWTSNTVSVGPMSIAGSGGQQIIKYQVTVN